MSLAALLQLVIAPWLHHVEPLLSEVSVHAKIDIYIRVCVCVCVKDNSSEQLHKWYKQLSLKVME